MATNVLTRVMNNLRNFRDKQRANSGRFAIGLARDFSSKQFYRASLCSVPNPVNHFPTCCDSRQPHGGTPLAKHAIKLS